MPRLSPHPGIGATTIGDIRVAYNVAGDGLRAILIHGLAQDHTMWASQQGDLCEFTTLAYDLRGHGDTTLGRAEGTLAQLGRDLIELLEQLGPSACVGFSLGGAVALWAASERPDLVERVVVIATSSVVGSNAVVDLTRRISLVEAEGADAIRDMLSRDTAAQLSDGFADVGGVIAERLHAARNPGGYLNGLRAMRGMQDRSLHRRLVYVRSRVVVVGAECDEICPPRAAELLLEGLPDARFAQIPGARHLASYTATATITRLIRSGLETSPR